MWSVTCFDMHPAHDTVAVDHETTFQHDALGTHIRLGLAGLGHLVAMRLGEASVLSLAVSMITGIVSV